MYGNMLCEILLPEVRLADRKTILAIKTKMLLARTLLSYFSHIFHMYLGLKKHMYQLSSFVVR